MTEDSIEAKLSTKDGDILEFKSKKHFSEWAESELEFWNLLNQKLLEGIAYIINLILPKPTAAIDNIEKAIANAEKSVKKK